MPTGGYLDLRSVVPTPKECALEREQFIEQYRAADAAVSEHESAAEQYAALAEKDKWERARIAFEAVESGEFSQRSFAEAVGKGNKTVARQCAVWRTFGVSAPTRLPDYTEAWAAVENDTRPAAGSSERAKQQVERMPAAERAEIVKQAMADPEVAREVVKDRETINKITHARVENLKDEPRGDTSDVDAAVKKARQSIAEHAIFATMSRLRVQVADLVREGVQLNPKVVSSEVELTRNALDTLESLSEFDGDWDAALASIDGGAA